MSGPPAWARQYVGLPYRDFGRDRSGVDCWGGARLVAREQFGLEVPSYVGAYAGVGCGPTLAAAAERRALAALIAGEAAAGWRALWRRASGVPFAAAGEIPGDFLLMRQGGVPCHVGIVIAPGWMLHVERGLDMALDEYRRPHRAPSLEGVYRYGG